MLAFVYGAGTMAFVHSKYMLPEPLFSVAFLSAVLFLFKYRKLRKVQYLLLSGCFAGVTILIRADAVLFIFGMSIGVAATLLKNYRTGNSSLTALIREVFFFVVPLLFFFSVFFYYNYSRFGNILETGYTLKNEGQIATLSYTSRFLNVKNTLGGFWGMWVIPCRSIFFINPVLVFVFFSLKEFWKKFKYESIVLLIIFAMYTFLYMNRGPKGFPGSAAWGARYMLPMVSFMVLPIGVFVENIFREKNDSLKKVFFSIFVISFVFQLIGSSINYQKVQMPLENVYKKLYNDPSMARLKLTTDPRWNLVYQNLKVLKTGRVDVKEKGQIYSFRVGRDSDFMFYNYLRRGNVPDWVIISLFFIITTLLTSGYLLFKPLLLPVKEPVRKEKFKGKKKKKRR
ncbi:hypothetical protein ISS37_08760 [candidate division KSB1 bacterium]|nr:hypothetical protein [candidate division KSB1 bacterium]